MKVVTLWPVVPTPAQPLDPLGERCTTKPVASETSFHVTPICVCDSAEAATPVGAPGAAASDWVEAETVGDGADEPLGLVAKTR